MLRHELVHLAIGELVRGKGVSVPLWLDEGLAMLYGDLPMELDRRELVSAVGSGSLIPLGELAGAFPDDTQPRVHLAYLEAESAVRRLRGLQGEKGLRELLARLGRGEKFEAAFAVVYGMPLERFGAEWAESLSTGSRALDWVRGVLSWTSMFTYLAALVVVAFLVQRLRRSRRKEEMDGGGEGEGGP